MKSKEQKLIEKTRELNLTCRECGYKLVTSVVNDPTLGVLRQYSCANSMCRHDGKIVLSERYNPNKDRYETMYK